VSYQIFDEKGHPQTSGTYDELWVSENKYKRNYTSPNFTQTDFATDSGLYRSGNQNWPGPQETLARTELLEAIPAAPDLQGLRLESNRRSIGKVNLQCVTLKGDLIFPAVSAYCFEPDKPILRYANESRQVPPHYPSGASGSGITGKVVLKITIGKDGRVTNAEAISGPTGLRQAAIDAVLKWEYRPFLIAGKPTEVVTTLPIIFSLG
jgi:TonB family protein